MTDLVREIRRRIEPAFRARGREVKLRARLWTPLACEKNGFDWRGWFAEGLLDGVAMGGTYGLDIREAVSEAHAHGMPIHVSLDCSIFNRNKQKHFGRIEYFRAAALNYYRQGVDGIYFYNGSSFWSCVYPGPVARAMPHLMEVGDPDCMERRSKTYVHGWHPDYTGLLVWSSDPGEERDRGERNDRHGR